jgi:hypothetical protein
VEKKMARNRSTTPKSKDLQIAKINALQAISVAIIAVIAAAVPVYFAGKQQGKESAANQSVQFISRGELKTLLDAAKSRIWATGYTLEALDPKSLADKIKDNENFTAKIVIVDPLSKVVCQREQDEHKDKAPIYIDLIRRIQRFNQYRKGLAEDNFQVRLSNIYPTIAVYIIDNNLCAFSYPYAAPGTGSPILKFTYDEKDERMRFFTQHFSSVFNSAKRLTDFEYEQYETISLENPCISKSDQ